MAMRFLPAILGSVVGLVLALGVEDVLIHQAAERFDGPYTLRSPAWFLAPLLAAVLCAWIASRFDHGRKVWKR